MTYARRPLAATLAAVAALATSAAPAAAKKQSFEFFADINCGAGLIHVGSGADLWSPLVDLGTGTKYKPVAWHVSGDGFAVDELKKGEPKKHAVVCSYSDGQATGTVTVKKA